MAEESWPWEKGLVTGKSTGEKVRGLAAALRSLFSSDKAAKSVAEPEKKVEQVNYDKPVPAVQRVADGPVQLGGDQPTQIGAEDFWQRPGYYEHTITRPGFGGTRIEELPDDNIGVDTPKPKIEATPPPPSPPPTVRSKSERTVTENTGERPGSIRAQILQSMLGATEMPGVDQAQPSKAGMLSTALRATGVDPEIEQYETPEVEPRAAASAGGDQPIPYPEAVDQPVGTNAARALQLRGGAGRPDMTPAGLPKKEEPTDWKGRWEGFKPFLPMVLGGIEGMTPEGRKRMHELKLAKIKHAGDKDVYKAALRDPNSPETFALLKAKAAERPEAVAQLIKEDRYYGKIRGDQVDSLFKNYNFDKSYDATERERMRNYPIKAEMAHARTLDSMVREGMLNLTKRGYELGPGSEFYDPIDENSNIFPSKTIAERFGKRESGYRAMMEGHIPEVEAMIQRIVAKHPGVAGRSWAKLTKDPDVIALNGYTGNMIAKLRDAEGLAVTDAQFGELKEQNGLQNGAFDIFTMFDPTRLPQILKNTANAAHHSIMADAQQQLGRGGRYEEGKQSPVAPRRSVREAGPYTGPVAPPKSILPKATAKGRPAPQAAVSPETPEIPAQSVEDMAAELAAIKARRAARAAGGE